MTKQKICQLPIFPQNALFLRMWAAIWPTTFLRCFREVDHTFLQSTLADFPRTSSRQRHVVAFLIMTPRMQPTSLVIYRRCQKLVLCSVKTGCCLIGCYQRWQKYTTVADNFHCRTVHLDIIKVFFYLPTDSQENCFKKYIQIYFKTAATCFSAINITRERLTELTTPMYFKWLF